jgi:hypothetical protein
MTKCTGYKFVSDLRQVGSFLLDQHAYLDFYCASLLKQQSVDIYVAPLGHIIMIPSQSVFALFR